ncbi:MAG: hypothetical protein JNL79_25240 [Myxococcales bacterium]|nr:hypothetical protein [Myxococcales bacterium]
MYSLSLAARRQRFVLTRDGVSIHADDGSVRTLPWSSVVHRRTREGLALLDKVTGDLYPLPRRAWGPPSVFVAVRTFVTDMTAPAKLPPVSWVVLVWLVIVVLQTVGIR